VNLFVIKIKHIIYGDLQILYLCDCHFCPSFICQSTVHIQFSISTYVMQTGYENWIYFSTFAQKMELQKNEMELLTTLIFF
jgi:hypothetical protein